MSANETNEKKPEKPSENLPDENAVCETCGKFGAYRFGDASLCLDCYEESGSCCAGEFQKKDGE